MDEPARDPHGDRMIRVAVVDDHYAIRIGLEAALAAEQDLEPVGAATSAAELAPLLYRTRPDVVVLDYRLPDEDGLTLCRRLKRAVPAPAVVLHSAFADDWLTVPAILAGVNAIVHKGAPGRALAEAIRMVADGSIVLPAVLPEFLTAASEPLAAGDRAILAMLVHGTSQDDVARVLDIDRRDLGRRLDRMLGTLRVVSPAA
jgi:DNA-binding NarL/FixJ family response regulator